MPVELKPLFELVVDGSTIGAFNREQLTAIRATISRLLGADKSSGRQQQILFTVSDYFSIEQSALLTDKRRFEPILWPRHAAIALLHDEGFSTYAIGQIFKQNHSTVYWALKCVVERIASNPHQAEQLKALRATLNIKP